MILIDHMTAENPVDKVPEKFVVILLLLGCHDIRTSLLVPIAVYEQQ